MTYNSINDTKEHWDAVFQNADYTQVLWHQAVPTKSLEFIKKYAKSDDEIIDVGCGASLLVDNLLGDDYKNISLLDTSITSLDIVKKRISANDVKYICSDILNFQAEKKFKIWHDSAVFHFLLTQLFRKKWCCSHKYFCNGVSKSMCRTRYCAV